MFVAGQYTYNRLLEICREVDAAIFIFGDDDKVWYRGTEVLQPRDNVLLEYGMFSAVLGPKRCIICTSGTPRIGTDLQGLTTIDVRSSNRRRAAADLEAWITHLKSSNREPEYDLAQLKLFKQSDHEKFTSFLRNQMGVAKKIVMAGCGLAVLGHPPVVKEIMKRTKTGECEVEIYMANPSDPSVQTRLIEEEHGSIKPPDGYNGLKGRLNMILQAWRRAEMPSNFTLRLFGHYPTFALVIVDKDYFVYPYAYELLGNFSPVLHFNKGIPAHAEIINFFDEHYERVKNDAVEATSTIEARASTTRSLSEFEGFALYFIPEASSALYRFGSQVLGYDIHTKTRSDSKWNSLVGEACQYGFHLTIIDLLYFPNSYQVEKAVKEIEFIISQSSRFELANIELKKNFPGNKNIAFSVRDETGILEVLHCEFVHRVYSRAIASEYTLKKRRLDRGGLKQRNEKMIERYLAPYILQSFRPHFTLLTEVKPEQMDNVYTEIARQAEEYNCEGSVTVNRLAIMKRKVSGTWIIKDFIDLA